MAHDGYRFFVRVWNAGLPPHGPSPRVAVSLRDASASLGETRPRAGPLGRVFFLHGIVSHGGWYESSCVRIAEAGFEVHFLDRRGSGLNAAARGDVDSPDTWVRDVADYIDSASRDRRPAILAGISWGGKLALAVARRHPGLIHGLALICPGVFSKFGAGWLERWAVGLASRTPARRRRVAIPLQDSHLFTDDPSWQRWIERDPLVLRRLTVRAARANWELGQYAENADNVPAIPILLMLAGRDRIIDNARTREFFGHLASPQKRLVEYPEAAHTFEFGPARQTYVDDFIDWCGRAMGNAPAECSVQEIGSDPKKFVEWVT